MTPRARLAGTLLGIAVLGVAVWRSLAQPVTSRQVDTCRVVLESEIARTVATWNARASGDEPDGTPEEHSDINQACAPLYAEPACRDAIARVAGSPAERVGGRIRACRDAYCPKLSPRPALCDREAKTASEAAPLWRELDDAILRHDLGSRAEELIAVRVRGENEVAAALAGYFEAGSPTWAGSHSDMRLRVVPRDAGEETRDTDQP
jgi:hypothetical protein